MGAGHCEVKVNNELELLKSTLHQPANLLLHLQGLQNLGQKCFIEPVLAQALVYPPSPSTKQEIILVLWIRIQIRSYRHHFAGSGSGSEYRR